MNVPNLHPRQEKIFYIYYIIFRK